MPCYKVIYSYTNIASDIANQRSTTKIILLACQQLNSTYVAAHLVRAPADCVCFAYFGCALHLVNLHLAIGVVAI